MTAGRLDDAWLEAIVADNPPPERDEWKAMDLKDEQDIYERFVPHFYFGCESDDRTVAFAYSPANAFGAELKPILSTDIGHWDVMDMEDVLPECYGLVEKGVLTPEQFRRFAFENPSQLHLRMNPDFFKGTRVEAAAAKLIGKG